MVLTISIVKNVYGGDGLGRLGDGRVVFVPGAFAGERVKAEIVEEKRNFVKARLIEIEAASPDRTGTDAPPIPGMVYANLTAAGETKIKEDQLLDALSRARLTPQTFVPSDLKALDEKGFTHYRNKAVYHFARQQGKWVLGYRLEPSHTILDLTADPLAVPAINAALPEIRRGVFALLTQGAGAVRRSVAQEGNVTVRWSARSGVKWWVGDAPKNQILKETTAGSVFEVPAGGFYQVNPVVGDALVRTVVADYLKEGASAPNLVDLYCGVGVFGLSCLKAASATIPNARLVGVESNRDAIQFAKTNAANLGLAANFFAEEVGRSTRRIKIGASSTVIVDPPRGGLEPNVPRWLAESSAPRIFYVSCDPATLVRDLRTLVSRYDLESVRWFNMFPRTARFETLAILKRRA